MGHIFSIAKSLIFINSGKTKPNLNTLCKQTILLQFATNKIMQTTTTNCNIISLDEWYVRDIDVYKRQDRRNNTEEQRDFELSYLDNIFSLQQIKEKWKPQKLSPHHMFTDLKKSPW